MSDATLFDANRATQVLAERYKLSEREQEALLWLLKGCSIDEVVALTGQPRRYVKYGRERVYPKLGVSGLAELLGMLGDEPLAL